MAIKRHNKISGHFSARLVEMLESPAYRALSLSAHRLISRIEVELASHGGNDNGKLPVTYEDFIVYGIDRDAIAPAIREAEALGFIRVTERGRGGNAEYRQPSKYFLTYAHARQTTSLPPTHEWRKHKTVEDAQVAAKAARSNKDPRAVAFGLRRYRNRNQSGNPRPKPIRESPTETANPPVGKSPATVSVGKPRRLSISRGGGEVSGLEFAGHNRDAIDTGIPPDLSIPQFLRRTSPTPDGTTKILTQTCRETSCDSGKDSAIRNNRER